MNILVVEDDPTSLKLVKYALEKSSYHVDGAETGLKGLDYANGNKYDCIILDIGLPDISGLDVLKKLRSSGNDTPILLLSSYDNVDTKVEGLESGADDYITKPYEFREMMARLFVITRRKKPSQTETQGLLRCGELSVDLLSREFQVNGKVIPLTNNEYSLLIYFLNNPGRVVDRMELSEKVWGISFDTQTNFVNVYLSYLRKKIREETEHEYIQTIRGEGFKLDCGE